MVQAVTPLISVIMPAYNAEAYIQEAIASVLNQSLPELELIVIDDCSADGTRQIVEMLAETDSRICLLKNEENMGVARTRNQGLDISRGEYVAFLDSDDVWQPEFLAKMLAKQKETEADIVYCGYALVDEKGRKLCNDFSVPPQITFEEYIVRSVITCSTVLITARVAENNRFPTDVYHEDTALWFRLLQEGYVARGVSESLAAYRQRSDSRSSWKLVSAIRRWGIYRKQLKLPVWKTVKTMALYGYYGIIKYKRIPCGGEQDDG